MVKFKIYSKELPNGQQNGFFTIRVIRKKLLDYINRFYLYISIPYGATQSIFKYEREFYSLLYVKESCLSVTGLRTGERQPNHSFCSPSQI